MMYPPEPWRLCGEMAVSLWRVPRGELPATPDGTSPVVLGGSGLVGTAWVVYGPGSVLEYNELLVAVLARRGGRPRVCITQIWVDSEASRQGGRDLWAIPKETATFEMAESPFRAQAHGIASARMTDRATLPLALPLRYKIAQQDERGLKESQVRATSRLALQSGSWEIDPVGPLGWLHGRRPMLGVAMHHFDMRFGAQPTPA